MDYVRADFSPLAATGYGVGVHWTTWTLPRKGPPLPFPEAVERFDVPAFVHAVRDAGAGHVMFMATHELHWLPGPNPVVDRILPGRTCGRDLIGELGEALNAAGIMMGVYYNHGVHHPVWEEWHLHKHALRSLTCGSRGRSPSRMSGTLKRLRRNGRASVLASRVRGRGLSKRHSVLVAVLVNPEKEVDVVCKGKRNRKTNFRFRVGAGVSAREPWANARAKRAAGAG